MSKDGANGVYLFPLCPLCGWSGLVHLPVMSGELYLGDESWACCCGHGAQWRGLTASLRINCFRWKEAISGLSEDQVHQLLNNIKKSCKGWNPICDETNSCCRKGT